MATTKQATMGAVRQLATPTDLKPDDTAKVTEQINMLVADAFALYLKTKNYHWHMNGSHYRDYHLLLDEQGDQIFAMTDVLAERVRKIGGTTIRSIGHIAKLQRIEDDNADYDSPLSMLQTLLNDNKEFTSNMRAAHEICDDANDVATTSILELFIDETERRTWFLYETTIGAEHTS